MFRTIKLNRNTCVSNFLRTTSIALAFIAVACASAKASSLYAASPYNVFVFGGFTETGADDDGNLAVGGNASFNGNYAIMQAPIGAQSTPNNDSLVVAGKITAGTADVDSGNAFLQTAGGGGSVSMSGGGTLTTGGTDPINFASTQTSLLSYSAYLDTLTANGTVSDPSGSITMTGTNATLDIFDITASQLTTGGITITVPNGATVLINVSGTTGGTTANQGFTVNGSGVNGNSTTTQADDILFNYYQATTLTLGGGFIGSILAPGAAVTGSGGQQIDGQLIAASFTGNTEFHQFLFTGTLPTQTSATPEPGSFAMLGLGLIFLGTASRKWMKR